jgi:hypothetical protein
MGIGYSYVYISPIGGAAPSKPIVTIFGKFSGLADVIKLQNFRTIGQIVFVRRVPENRMFPYREAKSSLALCLALTRLHVICALRRNRSHITQGM